MSKPPLSTASEKARAYWYGLVNFEKRAPAASELNLDRMHRLLARLGDPHLRTPFLHVAGTKGKGSTSAMLAAILQRAGYRTGLFTSPHLCCVGERFQVNSEMITDDELTDLLIEVRSAGEEGVTFFEVATAVGFLFFLRRRCDVAVLEVGLGGRFDSTNVCTPLAALIASISFDHMKQLGNRLASIAFEKAGIIKPGRPALSGATAPEARTVIEQIAAERGAFLRQLGVDFRYECTPGRVTSHEIVWPRLRVTTRNRAWPEMAINLLGDHQAANAAVAVACIEVLTEQGWRVPDEAVAAGLAEVRWPARMELLGRQPLVVLDCAHNVASASAVVETLCSSFAPTRRLLIFAGSSDKDVAGMFRVLAPQFEHAFLTRYTDNPRAIPQEDLAAMWRAVSAVPITLSETPAEAWQAARCAARAEDLICVTGSVFLAGEMRPILVGPRTKERRTN